MTACCRAGNASSAVCGAIASRCSGVAASGTSAVRNATSDHDCGVHPPPVLAAAVPPIGSCAAPTATRVSHNPSLILPGAPLLRFIPVGSSLIISFIDDLPSLSLRVQRTIPSLVGSGHSVEVCLWRWGQPGPGQPSPGHGV